MAASYCASLQRELARGKVLSAGYVLLLIRLYVWVSSKPQCYARSGTLRTLRREWHLYPWSRSHLDAWYFQ